MARLAPMQIRAIVIFGFTMSAAAEVISYINAVSMHAVQFDSFQDVVDPLIGLLISIVTVVAWSFLTRIIALDDSQRRVLRGTYLFFTIEFFLAAFGYNFIFLPLHSFGDFWITASLWFEFAGDVAVTIGLFLSFLSIAPGAEIEAYDETTDELSTP
jgi:hypothetical protein